MASPEHAPTAADAANAADAADDGVDAVDSALFRDVVEVHTARGCLDRALLDALTSSGLGEPELARVIALADGPQMRRGQAAWRRLQAAGGLPGVPAPTSSAPEVS